MNRSMVSSGFVGCIMATMLSSTTGPFVMFASISIFIVGAIQLIVGAVIS